MPKIIPLCLTSHTCVRILLHVCPHTATHVSSFCYVRVRILLHTCPHTATYVSAYCYICVLVLVYMCLHTAVYVSSYYYIRVCVYVSSYYCIRVCVCVLILLHTCPNPADPRGRLHPIRRWMVLRTKTYHRGAG